MSDQPKQKTPDGVMREPFEYSCWRMLEEIQARLGYAALPAPAAINNLMNKYGWRNVPHAWLRCEMLFEDFCKHYGNYRNPLLDLIVTPDELEAHKQRHPKVVPEPKKIDLNGWVRSEEKR